MMSPREVQVIVHCTFECLRCHACAIIDLFLIHQRLRLTYVSMHFLNRITLIHVN